MATLTEGQVRVARSWIGNSEALEVFQERFDRLGSFDDALTESLRAQLAGYALDSPGQFSTPSGYSQNTTENIRSLKETLAKFLASGGTDSVADAGTTVHVTALRRPDYR